MAYVSIGKRTAGRQKKITMKNIEMRGMSSPSRWIWPRTLARRRRRRALSSPRPRAIYPSPTGKRRWG